MKLRFKKDCSKKKKSIIQDNKIEMHKDICGYIEYASFNLQDKMWM